MRLTTGDFILFGIIVFLILIFITPKGSEVIINKNETAVDKVTNLQNNYDSCITDFTKLNQSCDVNYMENLAKIDNYTNWVCFLIIIFMSITIAILVFRNSCLRNKIKQGDKK